MQRSARRRQSQPTAGSVDSGLPTEGSTQRSKRFPNPECMRGAPEQHRPMESLHRREVAKPQLPLYPMPAAVPSSRFAVPPMPDLQILQSPSKTRDCTMVDGFNLRIDRKADGNKKTWKIVFDDGGQIGLKISRWCQDLVKTGGDEHSITAHHSI